MSTTYPRVCMPATEMLTLASSQVDQEYLILVGLPETYGDADSVYPVLYLLDGNFFFGTTVETVRLGAGSGELPEMIVVGIGYPEDTLSEVRAVRARDYTPFQLQEWYERTVTAPLETAEYRNGEVARFLGFVREELMLAVHSRYRADPTNRTLLGHSFGGTFGVYTLFHHPDTFERYVISSPTVCRAGTDLFGDEEEYATQNSDLPATAFISAGELDGNPEASDATDTLGNVRRLVETLTGRGYPSLRLHSHVFEGETHISVIPAAISRGLRMVHR